ncbi:MAG TPA: phage tail family protein [Candidatus Ornithomonoglobus intestinigallinarum]|uniref:Phage tail family protein n=1 Tax=Candidatus Ornithomonoglobus intestinigallinarum TaxID=2840894 RepID=A0A9D1H2Q3_9FIRM|nr:phage tail family protein [Candidatus Ornithomonoglobus intestinigallinarum]
MRKGFTFKNRHSGKFGILMKTRSRRLIPEAKSCFYTAPLMDGSYDFSAANNAGREFYNDRVFELDIQMTASRLDELERKCARAASWLTGSGELVFDSMPLAVWTGRFVSELSFTPERHGKKAVISAVFQARPIGRASFTTGSGIRLGDGVPLDSDIPLDMSAYFEKRLAHGENEIDFVNLGDFYVRPVLRFCFGDTKITLAEQTVTGAEITAAQRNITITCGDSKIMLEGIAADAVVDLEKYVVTDGSGNSFMNKMQGRFFELPPGRSTLSVYVSAPCTLVIDYAPQTIYDFDFSSIDWGETGA